VTHGKKNGTGLGMAIAKSVIDAHRGDIRIESEVNRGTTCFVTLPYQPSPAEVA
jgi:signal transduction histidine kinase